MPFVGLKNDTQPVAVEVKRRSVFALASQFQKQLRACTVQVRQRQIQTSPSKAKANTDLHFTSVATGRVSWLRTERHRSWLKLDKQAPVGVLCSRLRPIAVYTTQI